MGARGGGAPIHPREYIHIYTYIIYMYKYVYINMYMYTYKIHLRRLCLSHII